MVHQCRGGVPVRCNGLFDGTFQEDCRPTPHNPSRILDLSPRTIGRTRQPSLTTVPTRIKAQPTLPALPFSFRLATDEAPYATSVRDMRNPILALPLLHGTNWRTSRQDSQAASTRPRTSLAVGAFNSSPSPLQTSSSKRPGGQTLQKSVLPRVQLNANRYPSNALPFSGGDAAESVRRC